jgi:hypothetical protein
MEQFEMPKPTSTRVFRQKELPADRQLALTCVHAEGGPSSITEWGVLATALTLSAEGILRVDFQIETAHPAVTLPELQDPESNWGLWEGDVVEVFLQLGGPGSPYYEFQASPLGQVFQLRVDEPRVRFDRTYRCSGFKARAERRVGTGWSATLELPLREMGWDGKLKSIRGGLFAVLGSREQRTYWAAFLPPQAHPDFHLPGEFKRFFGA